MPEGFSALPPLHALRVFEVVSRHLNFRLAADELGVTQAAVAQQVRGLEANLGLRLFERLPRGLGLTEAGRGYSASVRAALVMIDDATRLLRPAAQHLTVSVTPTFAAKWLMPRLAHFAEAHPDIDLRLLASDRLSHFHTDGVDLAVRHGQPPFGPGLNAEWLMAPPIVAVASPALLARNGKPSDFEAFQRFTQLHDAHDFWPLFSAMLFQHPGASTAKHMRFNQTSLAVEAAINGQGIALATLAFVDDDIASGRLVQVFDRQLTLDKGFYLVWPRKARDSQALAVVRAWLMVQANHRQ